jgi:hypothetical protein
LICFSLSLYSDPEKFLEILETQKVPFLFHSDEFLQILNLAEIPRVKLAVVHHLVPRLVDPKASLDQAVAMFRYADEKSQVEEEYKDRLQTVNASVFNRVERGSSNILGGRGGRGKGRSSNRLALSTVSESETTEAAVSDETSQLYDPANRPSVVCENEAEDDF